MKKQVMLTLSVFALLVCHAQTWESSRDSGRLAAKERQVAKAISFYQEAATLLPPDSLSTATAIDIKKNLVQLLFSYGQRDKAEVIIWETLPAIEKLFTKQHADYALFYDLLGQKYFGRDNDKAEDYFSIAKDIREKIFGNTSLEYAQSCNNLGVVYNLTGLWDKALELHLVAKNIREVRADSLALAQSCNNLGDLYRLFGQYGLAEPISEKARQLREIFYKRRPETYGRFYAISCINLANLYRDMGQYKKAEALYIEGRSVREKVLSVKNPDYAASCDILATLYVVMGEYDKAEKLYLEAKGLRETIEPAKSSLPYAESIDNLSNLYRMQKRYADAELLLMEAKNIWERELGENDPALAINYNNVGLLLSAMKKYSEAETYFLKASAVWSRINTKNHPANSANAANLALVYRNMGKKEFANKYYLQSINTQYNQLTEFFQFTSENEKAEYISNIAGTGDEYYSYFFKSGDYQNASDIYSISLKNRNLILQSTISLRNTIYSSEDDELKKQFETWLSTKQQLSNIYTGRVYMDSSSLAKLEALNGQQEKELTRKSSSLSGSKSNDNSWQAIKDALKPGEAAIEFLEFDYHDGSQWTDSVYYAAVVLTKEASHPRMVPICDKKQLESALSSRGNSDRERLKNVYLTRGAEEDEAIANTNLLSGILSRKVFSQLDNVNKIYYAPAGLLHRVSFSALAYNEKEMLSDKFELVQLSSTGSIVNYRSEPLSKTAKTIVYGGIEYYVDSAELVKEASRYVIQTRNSEVQKLERGDNWNPLPGTLLELQIIKQIGEQNKFQVFTHSGVSTTEESVKSLHGKSSPSILHIASHGFFFPDPGEKKAMGSNFFRNADNPLFRSGLLLAGANNTWRGQPVKGIDDGILTAYEVSNLYLPNTRLVVLSACETALGDLRGSEGVFGLQRAFKMAGVKNLVMSLWKVPDDETVEFMEAFYKGIFGSEPINVAFRNAQSKLKSKYRDDPYKWAAWVLIQ